MLRAQRSGLAKATSPDAATHTRPNAHNAATGSGLTSYAIRAVAVDSFAIVLAMAFGFYCRYIALFRDMPFSRGYVALAICVFIGWLAVLALAGTYDLHIVGQGPDEFKRIMLASLWIFAILATLSFFRAGDVSRSFILGSVLMGSLLLILGRLILRQWLYARRRRGKALANTLVIGNPGAVEVLSQKIAGLPLSGYRVVGSVLPPSPNDINLEKWLNSLSDQILVNDVEAVAVCHSATLDPEVVKRLGWHLEGPKIDLLVEPTYGNLTGPRVTYRPAPGLPLIHLDEPQLIGTRRAVKRGMDLVMAAGGLILLSPLLLTIAFLIKVTSRGPVFFTHERVGQEGRGFRFVKFRTMVDGAHEMRSEILGLPDDGIADRYRNDPRVTTVGRVLRRWSIDELPQLFNVMTGSMSMVGPRPMLIEEMPYLADRDHRRHVTKPGLTGLWQVSGRKEVDWDERMRLDLYYVENWSPMLDVILIFRTMKAVLTGDGAH